MISQKRSLLASVSPLRMVTLVYLLPSDPISQGTGGGVIGMEHHQTLELGWSIEESRNVWLPVEFGAKNEDISIPSPYQRSGRGWEETSKGCLTTAVVVLITYLGVQVAL